QVHAEDLVAFMQDIKKQGKVRHIAISSTLPHIPTFLKWNAFDAFQIPYSALERRHENAISDVANAGCGTIIRAGVARGEPRAGLRGADRWKSFEAANLDELRAPGESRSAFLLRFTISHPGMHTTIVGTKVPSHLDENLAAANAGPLPQKTYEEAKKRL